MRGMAVVTDEVFQPILGDDRDRVIRSRHRLDCVDRFPDHDGDEFDLILQVSPQHISAPVARNFADTRQHLGLQLRFVGIGLLGPGVSVPDSCNHDIPPDFRRNSIGIAPEHHGTSLYKSDHASRRTSAALLNVRRSSDSDRRVQTYRNGPSKPIYQENITGKLLRNLETFTLWIF